MEDKLLSRLEKLMDAVSFSTYYSEHYILDISA